MSVLADLCGQGRQQLQDAVLSTVTLGCDQFLASQFLLWTKSVRPGSIWCVVPVVGRELFFRFCLV